MSNTIKREGGDVFLSRVIVKTFCNNLIGYWVANTPLHLAYLRHVILLHRAQNWALAQLNDNIVQVDPIELFWVDPDDINYISKQVPNRFGLVVDEQMNTGEEFEELLIMEAFRKRFCDGLDWEKTGYRKIINNSSSRKKFPYRCDYIDSLAVRIQEEGYQSQRELLAKNPKDCYSSNNDGRNPVFNEVTVNVGQDGELLWRDRGRHRLALAKILNINEIPVLIQARHCNSIDHPDV